jgi:hypothetical protein
MKAGLSVAGASLTGAEDVSGRLPSINRKVCASIDKVRN